MTSSKPKVKRQCFLNHSLEAFQNQAKQKTDIHRINEHCCNIQTEQRN